MVSFYEKFPYRSVFALTSWFRIEEQSMRRFEHLCRGSAFLVRRDDDDIMRLMVASHVVAPFKWPNFYPHQWLEHIHPKHVKFSIQIREKDSGKWIKDYFFRGNVTHHIGERERGKCGE